MHARKLDEAFKKLSKYLNVTGVGEEEKPLQEIIVRQENEITNLRNRLEVIAKAGAETRKQLGALRSEVRSLRMILRRESMPKKPKPGQKRDS